MCMQALKKEFYFSYRLPTEAEWEYVLALVGDREYNTYRGRKHPWSGEYTRSDERRSEGDQLANFKFGKGDYGGIAGYLTMVETSLSK